MSDPWNGVALILVVGLALLALATLADWRSARRARDLLHAPPKGRDTLDPLPAPAYVLDDAQRVQAEELPEGLAQELAGLSPHRVSAHPADDRFLIHRLPAGDDAATSGALACVLRGPLVLVCPGGIGDVREVRPLLERASAQGSGVVLLAPRIDPQVVDACAANLRHRLVPALPLVAGVEECEQVAGLTGGVPVTRADLQAGWLPQDALGRALLVVATPDSTLLAVPDPEL